MHWIDQKNTVKDIYNAISISMKHCAFELSNKFKKKKKNITVYTKILRSTTVFNFNGHNLIYNLIYSVCTAVFKWLFSCACAWPQNLMRLLNHHPFFSSLIDSHTFKGKVLKAPTLGLLYLSTQAWACLILVNVKRKTAECKGTNYLTHDINIKMCTLL